MALLRARSRRRALQGAHGAHRPPPLPLPSPRTAEYAAACLPPLRAAFASLGDGSLRREGGGVYGVWASGRRGGALGVSLRLSLLPRHDGLSAMAVLLPAAAAAPLAELCRALGVACAAAHHGAQLY